MRKDGNDEKFRKVSKQVSHLYLPLVCTIAKIVKRFSKANLVQKPHLSDQLIHGVLTGHLDENSPKG